MEKRAYIEGIVKSFNEGSLTDFLKNNNIVPSKLPYCVNPIELVEAFKLLPSSGNDPYKNCYRLLNYHFGVTGNINACKDKTHLWLVKLLKATFDESTDLPDIVPEKLDDKTIDFLVEFLFLFCRDFYLNTNHFNIFLFWIETTLPVTEKNIVFDALCERVSKEDNSSYLENVLFALGRLLMLDEVTPVVYKFVKKFLNTQKVLQKVLKTKYPVLIKRPNLTKLLTTEVIKYIIDCPNIYDIHKASLIVRLNDISENAQKVKVLKLFLRKTSLHNEALSVQQEIPAPLLKKLNVSEAFALAKYLKSFAHILPFKTDFKLLRDKLIAKLLAEPNNSSLKEVVDFVSWLIDNSGNSTPSLYKTVQQINTDLISTPCIHFKEFEKFLKKEISDTLKSELNKLAWIMSQEQLTITDKLLLAYITKLYTLEHPVSDYRFEKTARTYLTEEAISKIKELFASKQYLSNTTSTPA